MKNKLLSVSIVIATFNSERTLKKCLESIKKQDFPHDLIEIIIADGGSIDNTLRIAKKYNTKIINVDKNKQNAEYNKGIGINSSKNQVILMLDHDNILPHDKWLMKLLTPLIEDKELVAAEPLRFHHDKSMTILDRYFALLGGTDPVVYYLGKNSHLSWAFDKYNLYGKFRDKGEYYKITYEKDKIPALGGNGAAIRRSVLSKYYNPKLSFIHTDIMSQFINGGDNNIALIKDSIIHLTNNNVVPFLKRRRYFVKKYYTKNENRAYKLYNPENDFSKLFLFSIISVTFLIPLLFSIKGYLKKRDVAWFLHPFMCFAFLILYGSIYLKPDRLISDVFKK